MEYGARMVVTFGGAGKLKTIDAIHTWAGSGFFLAPPAALELASTVCGVHVQGRPVGYLWEIEDLIGQVREAGYSALVIDQWHDIVHATYIGLQTQYAVYVDEEDVRKGRARPDQVGSIKAYDRAHYNEMERYYNAVVSKLRNSDLNVHINSRTQEPYYNDRLNRTVKGGPKCSWRKLTDVLPHAANICQRALGAFETEPWNGRADCNHRDPKFHEKTWIPGQPRTGGPLNTREVLRLAGGAPPLPAALTWLDDWSEYAADGLRKGVDRHQVTQQLKREMVEQGIAPTHIAWALKNGVHRAELEAYGSDALLAGF